MMILDFVGSESKELFWRGAARGFEKTPVPSEQQLKEAVKGILEGYPPKTSGSP